MDALLHFARASRTPVVLQTEATECGLACLAMVANHHGHRCDLATLRRDHSQSMRGATLAQLGAVAGQLGLVARPVKAELDELQELVLPAILHWDFDHFVVLVRVKSRRALIHDPARGARDLPLSELSRHFTGICLELRPGQQFVPAAPPPRISLARLLGGVRDLRGAIAQVLLLTIALELFAILAPLFMQLVVDQAIVSEDRDLVTVLGLGFLVLVGVQVAVTAARAWLLVVLGSALSLQVTTGLFQHLLQLPMRFFEMRHIGDLSSRFESLATIQRTLTSSFVEVIVDGLMAVITASVMLFYSATLAAVVTGAAVCYALVRGIIFRLQRAAQDEQIGHSARQLSTFFESVNCIQGVKLFGRERQRGSLYANVLADNLNAGVRLQRLSIVNVAANGLIFGIENITVVCVGAGLVLDTTFSLGMLFAFISFKLQFATRTTSFVDKSTEFRMLGLHAERVGEIALASPEPGYKRADVDGQCASVELRGVSFRYSQADPFVVKDISLRIEAGESVAIIGPSGCGKTTLLKLMLGLLEPTHGEVLIGGVDIARTGTGYRERMGAVMQNDDLLAGSISANISFFDPQPDAARIEACARAVAFDDDVRAMPMGYSTYVGGHDSLLSGGQKQRVLLARALYKQPRILVLDEATSHLDPLRERAVNDSVRGLALTRIVVAHRAETIAAAGRVIAPWGPSGPRAAAPPATSPALAS